MRMPPDLMRESRSTGPDGRERHARPPLPAALGLSLPGFLVIGLAVARPAIGAGPTMSPYEQDRHVQAST